MSLYRAHSTTSQDTYESRQEAAYYAEEDRWSDCYDEACEQFVAMDDDQYAGKFLMSATDEEMVEIERYGHYRVVVSQCRDDPRHPAFDVFSAVDERMTEARANDLMDEAES